MFDKIKSKFQGIIQRLSEREIKEYELNEILDEFMYSLIESDVSYDTANHIIEFIKRKLIGRSIPRFKANLKDIVKNVVKEVLLEILISGRCDDLYDTILSSAKKPYVIVFFGVNGVGKTTTIAKIAKYLMDKGLKVVLACSDTFRAAAIEQLKYHADKLGIRMISHQYGADPAAVAYDAIEHAKSKGIDVVLIDTAGRQHSNVNLMEELRKIVRVVQPDLKILVLDALTGNDAVTQARYFNDNVGVDALIFTKVDADIKGGAIISVLYELKKPVFFLGVGQRYSDLIRYNAQEILNMIINK